MAFVGPVSHCGLRASTFRFVGCLPRARTLHLATRRSRLVMELVVGDAAVDFSLPASGSRNVSLTQLSMDYKFVILYFYPKDATPGCTIEASNFRDLYPEIEKLGGTVIGVSRDSVESHNRFAHDLGLNFPLVSDDGTLSEGFGVWKLRELAGKSFMGIERSTFILQNGKIIKAWRGIKAKGHAAEVIAAAKEFV